MIEIIVLIVAFFAGFLICKESEEEFPQIEKGIKVFENIVIFILLIFLLAFLIYKVITSHFDSSLFLIILAIVLLLFFIKKSNFMVLLSFSALFSLAYSFNEHYPLIFSFVILLSMFHGRNYKSLRQLFALK